MECDAIQRNANAKKKMKFEMRFTVAGGRACPAMSAQISRQNLIRIWFEHNDIQPGMTDVKSALSFIFSERELFSRAHLLHHH